MLGKIFGVSIIATSVALAVWASYELWQLERRWHYNWGYKPMVLETIRSTVKPECLQ